MLFAAATGGRTDGKEQDEAHMVAEIDSEASRPLAIEGSRIEQLGFSRFTANVRSCDP
jgi:hypothetical protein